jgi:hypothetical protein
MIKQNSSIAKAVTISSIKLSKICENVRFMLNSLNLTFTGDVKQNIVEFLFENLSKKTSAYTQVYTISLSVEFGNTKLLWSLRKYS